MALCNQNLSTIIGNYSIFNEPFFLEFRKWMYAFFLFVWTANLLITGNGQTAFLATVNGSGA
jgi:hypothetical protein